MAIVEQTYPPMMPLRKATRLGVSEQTLRRWVDKGIVDSFQEAPGKQIYVWTDSILRLCERRNSKMRLCDQQRVRRQLAEA